LLSQRGTEGWRRIVVRVAGSQVAAIAPMPIAFLLRALS